MTKQRTAIIIGAGPAGLTAAYELLTRTDIKPIIFEASNDIGGISKTVQYNGNRMDIGGHRFFSKSDRVMDWWLQILPMEDGIDKDFQIQYQGKTKTVLGANSDSNNNEKVMLLRNRLSRIFYLKQFFNYPLKMNFSTVKQLGFLKAIGILTSYISTKIFSKREEKTLEDFFINRFGNKLYRTFFKDYTEKVWGMECSEISAEWGAQRIKELSISKAIWHAITAKFRSNKDYRQKGTDTSLIERFLYPKYGPGQMWEEVAAKIIAKGGEIHMNSLVTEFDIANNIFNGCTINQNGVTTNYKGDYFFSTMPVKYLIRGMGQQVPKAVQEVAEGLMYRDFITVGMLLKKLNLKESNIKDNWIYVQESEVKLGRIQVFNNWSPYLVKDENTVWLGLEYFCYKNDELWQKDDANFIDFAIVELEAMGFAKKEDMLDATVIRMEKTYPAYFGSYNQFDTISNYTDTFENLFLVGRNGMHKYNNSDHSMLTAMTAVDNIIGGIKTKENIWAINTEMEYHEEASTAKA